MLMINWRGNPDYCNILRIVSTVQVHLSIPYGQRGKAHNLLIYLTSSNSRKIFAGNMYIRLNWTGVYMVS